MSEPDSPEPETQRPSVTILVVAFTDSWSLFDRLGSRASSVLASWLTELEHVSRRHSGTVIKTVGNGLLGVFDDRTMAVECAIVIMERVSDLRSEYTRSVGLDSTLQNAADSDEDSGGESGRPSARARIGLNYGPVVREANDVFGDAVNLAFRVQGLAAVDQIIATRDVAQDLAPYLMDKVRPLPNLEVRGKEVQVEVVEVVWEHDSTTRGTRYPAANTNTNLSMGPSNAAVELRHDGRMIRVDRDNRLCLMGRGGQSTLVVADTMVSREHASVEFRGGLVMLEDFSTNGTFVKVGDDTTLLRRETLVLNEQGLISLGRAFGEDADPVRFACLPDEEGA